MVLPIPSCGEALPSRRDRRAATTRVGRPAPSMSVRQRVRRCSSFHRQSVERQVRIVSTFSPVTTWSGLHAKRFGARHPRRLRYRSQFKATFTRTINAAAAAPGVHPHTQDASALFPRTTTASQRTAMIEQPAKAVVDGADDAEPCAQSRCHRAPNPQEGQRHDRRRHDERRAAGCHVVAVSRTVCPERHRDGGSRSV